MSHKLNSEALWIFTLAFLQFFHVLDFVIMMPLAPVFMRELSINSSEFGLLVSAYTFTAAPASLIIGSVSDRFSRNKFNTISVLGFMVTTFLCGLARTYEELLFARVITGAFAGMLSISIFSILSSLISLERRGRATGIVMSAFSFASVIGIPIGLSVAQAYGWRMSFIGMSVLCVIPLLVSWFTFPEMSDHIEDVSQVQKSSLKKYKDILKNKKYRLGILSISLMTLSSFLMIPFLSTLFVNNLGMSEENLSLVYFFGGGTTILSSWIMGYLSDMWSSAKAFYLGSFISFIAMLNLAYMGAQMTEYTLWISLSASTFFMCFVASRFIPCMAMITKIPRSEDRGAYMSLVNAFRSLAQGASTYFGGIFLIENVNHAYTNFHHLVYLSIVIVLIVILLVRVLENISVKN